MSNRQTVSLKLSAIILVGSILLSGCILAAEETPQSPTSTPTPADLIIPPTATSAVTEVDQTTTTEPTKTEPLDTQEPTSTFTLEPTEVPTDVPVLSPTPFPYGIQTGTPAYITNFAHPDEGCSWIGVAGQVFDGEGNPLLNQVVFINGQYDVSRVELIGLTGTVEGDIYGPGGYEVVISDNPVSTQGQLVIQVFDLNGIPVSDTITFDTFSDCEKNLIIINFTHQE